ncbi:MAG: hypothetical protein Fur0018_17060 [Anaerolineales bacterium]
MRIVLHLWLCGLFSGLLAACGPAAGVLAYPNTTLTPDSPPPEQGYLPRHTPHAPAEPTLPRPLPTVPPVISPTAAPTLDVPGFTLQVPLPVDANRRISPNYRFGTTMDGQREIHHGVEFENPIGTPVLAAADGEVVFAGDDRRGELAPWGSFYGNVVVLAHQVPGGRVPVFTLYAHLSEIQVQVGQRVQAGDRLGSVGMSGSADGPHLHFEVRVGKNAYVNSSNPELWLQPDEQHGTLVGRIARSNGHLLVSLNVVLIPLDDAHAPKIYLQTYAQPDAFIAPLRDENFAIWNLPAGRYRLEFILDGVLQRTEIVVSPGERTRFTFP